MAEGLRPIIRQGPRHPVIDLGREAERHVRQVNGPSRRLLVQNVDVGVLCIEQLLVGGRILDGCALPARQSIGIPLTSGSEREAQLSLTPRLPVTPLLELVVGDFPADRVGDGWILLEPAVDEEGILRRACRGPRARDEQESEQDAGKRTGETCTNSAPKAHEGPFRECKLLEAAEILPHRYHGTTGASPCTGTAPDGPRQLAPPSRGPSRAAWRGG